MHEKPLITIEIFELVQSNIQHHTKHTHLEKTLKERKYNIQKARTTESFSHTHKQVQVSKVHTNSKHQFLSLSCKLLVLSHTHTFEFQSPIQHSDKL